MDFLKTNFKINLVSVLILNLKWVLGCDPFVNQNILKPVI